MPTNENFEKIISYILEKKPKTKAKFDDFRRKICASLKICQPSNQKLLACYHKMLKEGSVEQSKLVEHFLIKANIRSMSGIAVITSLVKPFMCPGKCVYCPTEVRMPKSYIASEPAAARSLRMNFDPYDLMQGRILMLERNGHPCDKIEYITKGGTWNAYKLKYQYWYILESFRACNNLTREIPTEKTTEEDWNDKSISDLQKAMDIEQKYNETAKHRIIGITLETRPDAITPKSIYHMRRQGCTRIELGLQAPDDVILKLVQRGHTVDQFRKAILLLRISGFKVDLHFMPDLPGTTPDHDIEMYESLFSDLSLRPDMVKIYPNTVIPSAELYQWLLDGRYKPYGKEGLYRALLAMKLATPRYCRISRLIRDIPSDEIKAGNIITNLRQELELTLKKTGQKCVCLRCREVGRQMKNISTDVAPQIFVDEYDTIGGREYFITLEDPERIAVFGFLRLRLPYCYPGQKAVPARRIGGDSKDPQASITKAGDSSTSVPLCSTSAQNDSYVSKIEKDQLDKLLGLGDLDKVAFIRELHTYGQLVKIGMQGSTESSQHKGLGKRLMAEAEKIASKNKFKKIAVISGVGVRGYYEKLGYEKCGTYVAKELAI